MVHENNFMSESNVNSLRALNLLHKNESIKGNLFSFDIDLIHEQVGFNPRNYEREDVKQHIENLAACYEAGQDMPPLIVKVIDGKIYVREGHCRLRAAKLARENGAQIKRLPVYETKGDETEQSLIIVRSDQGLKLTPLERAAIYVRLINQGNTAEEIAKKLGKTANHVKQYEMLFGLPLELKRLIEDGSVAWSLALETYKEMGSGAIEFLNSALKDEVAKATKVNPVNDLFQGAGGGEEGDKEGAEKPKPRLTASKLSSHQGFRSRLTPKLVKSVTQQFEQVVSKLDSIDLNEADSEEPITVQFSREEIEQIKKLYEEIKPKDKDADTNPQGGQS